MMKLKKNGLRYESLCEGMNKMSGGYFNYDQYRIRQIADEIKHLIETNNLEETDHHGSRIGHSFPKEIIAKFIEALKTLRIAEAMTQRIDWLLSGDDGEESFLQRWDEELSKIVASNN